MTQRILLATAHETLAHRISQLLRSHGYEIYAALDVATAITTAAQYKVSGALLDLAMPNGDAIKILRQIRDHALLKRIPVIAMSSREPVAWRMSAMEIGITATLNDPIEEDKLVALFKKHVPVSSQRTSGLGQQRVLVVEDDPDAWTMLNYRLSALGCSVSWARDGASAVQVALKNRPNLIVLDIGLPAGNGYIVLDRLKRNPTLSRIPVFILTVGAPEEHRDKCLKAGAAGFYQKSFQLTDFIDAVRNALENA